MIAVYVGLDFYLFSDIELVALSGETSVQCVSMSPFLPWICSAFVVMIKCMIADVFHITASSFSFHTVKFLSSWYISSWFSTVFYFDELWSVLFSREQCLFLMNMIWWRKVPHELIKTAAVYNQYLSFSAEILI
jgi:hypothetical protein